MNSKRYIYFLIACLMISMSLTVKTYNVQGELRTSQGKIFNGMYANYTFDVYLAGEYNTTFEYTRISGDIYNVTWEIPGEDLASWFEVKQTRIISNSSGSYIFNDGSHAPIWLFTNISIGNFTSISVDGEGDHLFEVVADFNVTLPGIGKYETWVLQDTIYPASIAFYEKSTGLLMAGIFYFAGGPVNYTLTLTSTNVFSHYQAESKGIPGYDLFFLIPIISIMSIIILIKRRKKL